MSKSELRKDKTCLNCRYVVENRFCPNCGQENTDTRKTFIQLFIHFFEDLTHYENSFWKTIRNLIFRPASLTKEYLSGKRMSYLAPIRLYIFISFVSFFVISIIPEKDENEMIAVNEKSISETVKDSIATKKDSLSEEKWITNLKKNGYLEGKEADSIQKIINESKNKKGDNIENEEDSFMNFGYSSIEELDSVQKYGKPADKENAFGYWIIKKTLQVKKGRTQKEVKERFLESFIHNIPKALFIYMPLFAFVLWLFQNKKRWYYFDHGIFTLHYFSFLLLASLILELCNFLIGMIGNYPQVNVAIQLIDTIIIVYMLYYFFPAHHRFYGQSRIKTILKGVIMFFINIFILSLILVGIAVYSFINIH